VANAIPGVNQDADPLDLAVGTVLQVLATALDNAPRYSVTPASLRHRAHAAARRRI
jgi:hypothetical protein